MKAINIILLSLLFFYCTQTSGNKQTEEEIVEVKLTKLEELLLLPTDTVMDYYDLSNDSIIDFPNLSDYTIKSLDLSYNQLDTVIVDFLPKGIITLNLSHNSFCEIFRFIIDPQWQLHFDERKKMYEDATIREIDLSHNKLTGIDIGFPLRKIVVSHNDIIYTDFSHGNIEYLDISHNPNLSNVVQFDPNVIDTIIRNNIANDKELIPSNRILPHIDYIILDDSIN